MPTSCRKDCMFKLGAFTDEISQDLDHACSVCDEFGVVGAEIRGVWGIGCHLLTDAQVREVKRIVADHGMVVCSIGSPFGKCDLASSDEVARHMDVLRRCSDVARELGCTLIRGFAFWKRTEERPWDAMLKAYEPVPDILAEKGTILGLENEAACYVGTARHTRTFLDRLACPYVKAIWEPANHVQDPDSAGTPAFPDGYAVIRDDIVHVHVKDAAPDGSGAVPNVFMGTGIVGWERQFEALKQDGYEGFVSLETHVAPGQFPEALAQRYGWYMQGEGGEGPSRVCLAWIRDSLDALA